jgi:hypothetical protein
MMDPASPGVVSIPPACRHYCTYTGAAGGAVAAAVILNTPPFPPFSKGGGGFHGQKKNPVRVLMCINRKWGALQQFQIKWVVVVVVVIVRRSSL